MTGVARTRGIAVGIALVLGLGRFAPGSASTAGPVPVALALRAEFQHDPPTGVSYRMTVSGVLDLGFVQDGPMAARATFVLGHEGCFVLAAWRALGSVPAATRGAEICIASPTVQEADVGSWLRGGRGVDPSLTLALAPLPSPPGAWANAEPVAAQAVLRGCGNDAYRKLGDLRADAGGLAVQQVAGQFGQPEFVVSGTGIVLENVSPAVWSDVLGACGGAQAGLPTTPVPGSSVTFTGATERPPGDPSSPGSHIEGLRDAVRGLVANQVLAAGPAKSLTRKLDGANKKLRQANTAAAARQIELFEHVTTSLRDRGTLPGGAADSLLNQAGAARGAIYDLDLPPPLPRPDPDAFCPASADCPENLCAYTTYYVEAGRGGLGLLPDGSPERPYPTIADALARAAADGRCGANLIVARGEYVGDILLDRNLRIHGAGERRTTIAGSLFSSGAFELVLEDVRIDPSGRGVYVDNPCASTTLLRVRIEGAREYGLVQRGGALDVQETWVSSTESHPDHVSRGTGMFLTCGVQVVLQDVTLVSNASGGLQVVGDGTLVTARLLEVAGTGVHPAVAADPCTPNNSGAVRVRDGARIDITRSSVHGNDLYGLVASGAGARASFRSGNIRETAQLPGACGGGLNAVAVDGGALELTSFGLQRADLAGLQLLRGGVADLHVGWITDNPIGANVQTEDFDVSRLQDRVTYRNDTNLDGGASLTVPGTLDGL